jgi:hypothetical protein
MNKKTRKLTLSRETLRHLNAPNLRQVVGAESGSCPTDCDPTTNPPTNPCGTAGCASVEYSCTCPPASFADSRCWACD